MTTETISIEELIGDDPEIRALYEKSLRRMEFQRKWGVPIKIACVVAATTAFVIVCFVIANG